jgi:hypothetical protein
MIKKMLGLLSGVKRWFSLNREVTAAIELTEVIYEGLKTEKGVHIETAISAAGAVGGVTLLRSKGLDFSKINPGEPVFVQGLDQEATAILATMSSICQIHGLNPGTGWTRDIPEVHASQKSYSELILQFERVFRLICEKSNIPTAKWPEVAGISAIKIIKQGENVLDPEIGKAIAVKALVHSSKSAPPKGSDEA